MGAALAGLERAAATVLALEPVPGELAFRPPGT
jgi:hypothetical protein